MGGLSLEDEKAFRRTIMKEAEAETVDRCSRGKGVS